MHRGCSRQLRSHPTTWSFLAYSVHHAINGSPWPRSKIGAGDGKKRQLLCRRHAVLREIDFQRAARRGETCFDDDADYYPSYAAGRGFVKKRAASLISSIRRPGNVPSKLLVDARRVDARGHALIRRCSPQTEILHESWSSRTIVSKFMSEQMWIVSIRIIDKEFCKIM